MCVHTVSSLPASAIALVLSMTPAARTIASLSPAPGSSPSSAKQSDDFNRSRDAANEAAESGDWDTVLRAAEEGLEALPENDATHARRASLIDLVGKLRLDDRTRPQLEDSASILRAYTDELRRVYGDQVEARSAWVDANAYLDDVEERLRDAPPPPTTAVPTQAPSSTRADHPRAKTTSRGTGLQVAGAVSLGLGAALVIVGFVYASRWSSEASAYNQLQGLNAMNPGSVSPAQEESQYAELRRARATSLGAGIPGLALLGVGIALVVVGTKRARGADRVSATASSIRVLF
jgi:hypothetical protein